MYDGVDGGRWSYGKTVFSWNEKNRICEKNRFSRQNFYFKLAHGRKLKSVDFLKGFDKNFENFSKKIDLSSKVVGCMYRLGIKNG